MNFDDDLTMNALKFICGQNSHVCRFCFAITEKGEISIEDYVQVQTYYNNEIVSFNTIFHELGVSTEEHLPHFICLSCAKLMIDSYNFQKLYVFSNKKWDEAIDRLDDSLARSEIVGGDIKSIYLMINKKDNLMLTNRRKTSQGSKRMALKKLKEVMRNKQKYSMDKDNAPEIICKECGERFNSRILHLQHMRMHNESHNPCEKCPKIFSTPELLKEHEERIHQPKRIPCTKCTKMFSTERLLRIHIRMNHIKVLCKLCSQQLPSQTALRTHMDKHWINECPHCNKTFYNRQSFKHHIKICGNDEESFFCDLCKKGFVRKTNLQSHLKMEHGFGDIFQCEWCEKKFDAHSRLREHMVKHTRERNFTCHICHGKFVTRSALLYHIRLHTGEKPYNCDYCSESFVSASRRLTHVKRKHLEPTLECHICHAKFAMNNTLRNHIRRHSMPNSKLYVPQEE